MTAAAQRLERRSDIAPRRPETGAHTRSQTRSQARPETRSQTRPQARQATGSSTRPGTRPQARVRVASVPSPRPLARRDTKAHRQRQAHAGSGTLANVEVFRPRVPSAYEERQERRASLRNHLRSVPQRRRFAAVLAPALVLVFLAMLGITTFQTRMAEDQVQLDRLLVKVDKARVLHQTLERQQAELRSPVRLGREAARLHLVAADAVGFVDVDQSTYRTVLASSAGMSLEDPGTSP